MVNNAPTMMNDEERDDCERLRGWVDKLTEYASGPAYGLFRPGQPTPIDAIRVIDELRAEVARLKAELDSPGRT